jgi:hypothetical protein
MRTFVICICLFLGMAHPAKAFEDDPLLTFAACAGRLSAVMEYQWMFDGAASETTQTHRAAVLDLLNAVMEPARGRDVLMWRLQAKQAQYVLLTRATFNEDPEDAAWAWSRASYYQKACTSLLLS